MLALEEDSASSLWMKAWQTTATGQPRTHARGNYVESLHSVLALTNPRRRWVTSRRPAMNPAFALAEVIWIMRGRSDSAFLTAWNSSLPNYAGQGDVFYGAYGERVRSRYGFDQLERAAAVLAANPEQRQVVLQIWDPKTDFPTENGQSRSPDIPCNVTAMLKVVDSKLEWLQVMRSNDLVLGLPYNLIQWTCLQEVMAGWMNIDVGSYVHVSDSLHIYERDLDTYEAAAPEDDSRLTDLRLPQGLSKQVFSELEQVVEALAKTQDTHVATELATSVHQDAYLDWTRVLAAERIRRLGDLELAMETLSSIRDAGLKSVSQAWHSQRKAWKATQ